MKYSSTFTRNLHLCYSPILVCGLCVQFASPAHAQYTGLGCTWTNKSIPVYFNTANISANGFNVGEFREELIDAMQTWNEQAQGRYDLYYAGYTTAVDGFNSIVMRNDNTWFCIENTSGKAFNRAAGRAMLVRPIS